MYNVPLSVRVRRAYAVIDARLTDFLTRGKAALESYPMPSNKPAMAARALDRGSLVVIEMKMAEGWKGFNPKEMR